MSDVRGVMLGGKYVKDCCGAAGASMGHSWKCPIAYPSMNKESRFLEWLEMPSGGKCEHLNTTRGQWEEYRHSIYRPFLQGHHSHNCYPPHCGRKFAVYHSVHGYVVPGTECSDRDELRLHLERLNRA